MLANVNINTKTGIPYGVVSMNSLKDWVWDEIYSHCESLTYKYWEEETRKELQNEIEALLEDGKIEKDDEEEANDLLKDEADIDDLKWFLEDIDKDKYRDILRAEYEPDEEEWEGEIPDEKGTISVFLSYIGGAPTLWVAESPYTTQGRMCSPCVPGAVDLDSKSENGFDAYDVPPDWYVTEDDPY